MELPVLERRTDLRPLPLAPVPTGRKRPTLTIVTPTYFPELIGTPHYARDLANWFSDHGWDVTIVTSQPFYPEFKRFDGYGRNRRHDTVDGLDVLRLPTVVPKHGKPLGRALSEANFVVQGVLRSPWRKTDAVLTISPGTPYLVYVGRAFTKRRGKHVVRVDDIQTGLATVHGAGKKLKALIRRGERRSLRAAPHVTTLTPEMADVIRDIGGATDVPVHPLWITLDERPDEAESTAPSIQYSGNFGEKQGVSALVEFAEALKSMSDDAVLTLRGAGAKFDGVCESVIERGLGNVRFEAPVPVEELPKALAKSPVHLVTQQPGTGSYAMPSKVINALACGSYVLALAEKSSSLGRLAETTMGMERFDAHEVDRMAARAVEILQDRNLAPRRRMIADNAFATFARDRVLGELAEMLWPN